MEELKHCPFCGGKPELHQGDAKIDAAHLPDGYGGFFSRMALSYEWFVKCEDCGSRGIQGYDKILREQSGEIVKIVDGRKNSINLWNRRSAE